MFKVLLQFLILAITFEYCFSVQYFLKWNNPINIVSLNSRYDEFAPEFNRFDSAIYFNSTKNGSISSFYISQLIDSNHFSNPQKLKGEINETGDNVSFISFLSDDRAYLTSFRMGQGRPYFNIFESIRTREGWSAPIALPEFEADYNIMHPAISPDGNMMVFVSDKDNKISETDIYIKYKNQLGTWSEPENLTVLNTELMEITPRFHSNDTLFFASNGQSGPGGYDIFYTSRRIDGSWTKPNPVNEINTIYDESDFIVLPGQKAIFTSNRPGGKGGFDLFLTGYYWTENTIPPERWLDISIATQIVNIKTMSDFTYEYSSLPNAIISDITNDALNKMLVRPDTIFEFTGNINLDYEAGINEMALKMVKYPDAKLMINYVILESQNKDVPIPDSYSMAIKVRDYLIEKWGIAEDRIELQKKVRNVSGSELSSFPVIFFDSDNSKMFNPIATGNRKISTDPPFSDVYIKIKPAESFISSITKVMIGNRREIFNAESEKTADQFTIPLNQFSGDIAKTDSLVIRVLAINKFGDTITKSLQFDITHSESMKRKRIEMDDREYEQITLFIPELENENLPVYLRETTNIITEAAAFTKSIRIQFFSLLAQAKALNYLNILKREINLPNLKVDIEQLPYNENQSFSRKFTPFILNILLEKP